MKKDFPLSRDIWYVFPSRPRFLPPLLRIVSPTLKVPRGGGSGGVGRGEVAFLFCGRASFIAFWLGLRCSVRKDSWTCVMWEMVAALANEGVTGLSPIAWRGAVKKGVGAGGKGLSGRGLGAVGVAVSGASVGRDASEAATACGGAGAGMEKASEAPKLFRRGWHVTADTLVFEEVEGGPWSTCGGAVPFEGRLKG